MVGHVNMMDDVLISNPLRALLARGPTNQQTFIQHVQAQLQEAETQSRPDLTNPKSIFPRPGVVSEVCLAYLARARCLFSAKMASASIRYHIEFIQCLVSVPSTWPPGSPIAQLLDTFSGDVIQSMQALRETGPEGDYLLGELDELLLTFTRCRDYCDDARLPFPFERPERQVQDVMVYLYPEEEEENPLVEMEGGPRGSIQARLPESSPVETVQLGSYQIPRLFNGLWQLSSPAWGSANSTNQERALLQLIETGLVAADMADHYGDAELVYGGFRNKLSEDVADKVYAATKWCVFKPINRQVTSEWVLERVRERHRRLGGRIELLQFHWHNYDSKEYLAILLELVKITKSHPELVSSIGLCNFDSDHTDEVCEYIKSEIGEVGVVSNQIQFSLIDTRPLKKMIPICQRHNLKLLTYGTFCGGLLSPSWLNKPPPPPYSTTNPLNPSQRKYFDIITLWSSWPVFQSLLSTLSRIAGKHSVQIPQVAARWILQQPAVASVIIGTRLGVAAHGEDNVKVFGWELDEGDMSNIDRAARGEKGERTDALFEKLGDCGNEYRSEE
ncbi:hypothetical protein PT974_04413 [Cladobotryum mycophilum]|uniref:NADP-dependent oxidoreductase domain-containing protein n=1 Tax=Cladobotryum mycophilum TaxID=491253 RepID=A0ABR0SW68_9HYPO